MTSTNQKWQTEEFKENLRTQEEDSLNEHPEQDPMKDPTTEDPEEDSITQDPREDPKEDTIPEYLLRSLKRALSLQA